MFQFNTSYIAIDFHLNSDLWLWLNSIILLLFLIVMTMKSKTEDGVYDDPGMSTSGGGGTQRGVMLRIMIEKQPNKWPS